MIDAPRYGFGEFELDTGRFQLRKGVTALDLEPKALAVLRLLIERAPNVVDKAEIFAAVWKDTAVTDNALTRIVAQLRKGLGDDAKDPRYIATISTRGYRLLPAVRRIEADGPPEADSPRVAAPGVVGAPEPTEAATASAAGRPPGPAWRRPIVLATAGGFAGVVALGAWLAIPARPPAGRVGSIGDLDLAVAASLRPEQMTVATGFDGYVAFSPDGTTIAYSSDRSGRLEIYVEGLAEGSTPTSLTRGSGQSVQPAWSPDGQVVAYHEMSGNGIWVVPSRGGSARQITEFGAHPTWSPDSRRIVFQSRPPADLNPGGSFGAESTIWIVDVDGRTPPRALTTPGRPLGSHGVPRWWPASEQVVFAVAAPAGMFLGAALWTVGPDTGELRLLSAHPSLSSEFVPSPDGGGVLFAAQSTNALWWLPVAEGLQAGEPRPTAFPTTGPVLASLAVSADGRRVAWTAAGASSGIWAAAAGTGVVSAPTPIVPASDVGWRAAHPAVAPDGRIAFMGNRGNAGYKIFLVEPGGAPRQLTTDARDHFSPFWVKGQDALVTLANHGDGLGWWRLDPATGRERFLFSLQDITRPPGVQSRLIGPSAGVSISPDLQQLAVAYTRDGVPNLWTARLGARGPTSPLVQRTFEPISGAFGSWSRDGRWLAYQCGRGSSTEICVVDADGGQPARQLTHEAGTNFIGEWADDETILFAAKRAAVWNIMSVARTTGKATILTAFSEPRFYVRYPRWDAARHRVVFERDESAGRLWSLRLPDVSAGGSPGSAPSR